MSEQPPQPGWWKASDGRWYPPEKRPGTDQPPAPGWWKASNGRWYPPEKRPGTGRAPTATVPGAATDTTTTSAAPEPAAPAPEPAAPEPARAPEPAPVAKKAVVKKVAVKKVAVKKVAAKKPTGTDRPAAKAASSPGGKSSGVVRRQDLDDLDLTDGSAAEGGRTPEEQIAIRNRNSQADARLLANARSAAASRALDSLRSQIQAELANAPAPQMAAPPPVAGTPTPAAPAPPSAAPGGDTAPVDADAGVTIDRAPTATSGGETPLMEIKPSTMASDIDRIGERLVIFEDRVELHERHGRVRQTIAGDQIADVVVAKRFTGHQVTVEAGDGTTIQLKGLRPEQAEEIRELIMRRTRRIGPAPERATRPTGAATGTPIDAADLLSKLDDLHRAGVLTAAELAEKQALVASMAGGERLAPTAT